MTEQLKTGLAALIHALPEAGKTTLFHSAPGPRLFLDVDRGTRGLPNRVLWDPTKPPPTDAETVIVPACDLGKVNKVLQWLESGQHPFKAVCLDTVSALQRQAMLDLVGTRKPDWDDWGSILRYVEKPLADLTALVEHPTNPIPLVVVNCHSRIIYEKDQKGQETERIAEVQPYLQGQVGDILPWYVDLIGYLEEDKKAGDGTRNLWFKMAGTNNGKRRFPGLPEGITNPSMTDVMELCGNAA